MLLVPPLPKPPEPLIPAGMLPSMPKPTRTCSVHRRTHNVDLLGRTINLPVKAWIRVAMLIRETRTWGRVGFIERKREIKREEGCGL